MPSSFYGSNSLSSRSSSLNGSYQERSAAMGSLSPVSDGSLSLQNIPQSPASGNFGTSPLSLGTVIPNDNKGSNTSLPKVDIPSCENPSLLVFDRHCIRFSSCLNNKPEVRTLMWTVSFSL